MNLVVTGIGGYRSFARRRQVAAARRTGRRTATVTLAGVTSTPTVSGTVAVRFSDGSRIDLRPWETRDAVRALSELPDLPALIAGHGAAAMTVLVLPKPPLREKPVLFAARAETYRWLPEP